MSSFWKFFTGEEGEGESSEGDGSTAPESEAREVARSDRPPRTERPPKEDAVGRADRPPRPEKSAKSSTAPAPNNPGSQPPPPTAGLPSVIVDHKPARSGAPPAEGSALRYGIDEAIKLMRTLPVEENVELVVRVIKTTLESLRVRVGDIIDDASRRQDALRKKNSE